jgi:hypothetical protein
MLARRSRGTGEPMSRSSVFVSKKTSDRPGLLLIHALAVQRPNESNPLGCDIVKPVFPALSYDDGSRVAFMFVADVMDAARPRSE